jgi:hypothetical protein
MTVTEPKQASIKLVGVPGFLALVVMCLPWWIGAWVVTKATLEAIF